MNILAILAIILGISFIWNYALKIITYVTVQKHKRFLKVISLQHQTKSGFDYDAFTKRFHSVIKMLRHNKYYFVVNLFSVYLLVIRDRLELCQKDDPGFIYNDIFLKNIGYSNYEWELLCKSMSDINDDHMLLKELFWWPALSLKLEINSILKR